ASAAFTSSGFTLAFLAFMDAAKVGWCSGTARLKTVVLGEPPPFQRRVARPAARHRTDRRLRARRATPRKRTNVARQACHLQTDTPHAQATNCTRVTLPTLRVIFAASERVIDADPRD